MSLPRWYRPEVSAGGWGQEQNHFIESRGYSGREGHLNHSLEDTQDQ